MYNHPQIVFIQYFISVCISYTEGDMMQMNWKLHMLPIAEWISEHLVEWNLQVIECKEPRAPESNGMGKIQSSLVETTNHKIIIIPLRTFKNANFTMSKYPQVRFFWDLNFGKVKTSTGSNKFFVLVLLYNCVLKCRLISDTVKKIH